MGESQWMLFWTGFAAVGTTTGVVVALLLPILQKSHENATLRKFARRRIGYELIQLLQTLRIAREFPAFTTTGRDGKHFFKFDHGLGRHTYFRLVDSDKAIEAILENMVKLPDGQETLLTDLLIRLKNVFSGAEIEQSEFEETLKDLAEAIRINVSGSKWLVHLDGMIKAKKSEPMVFL